MIARKSVLTFANNVVLALLGYVAMFFIARYMSATEFGQIGYAMGFVGMFGFVADLGFGLAHIKRISEGANIEKCIGTYLVIKTVLTVGIVVCVLSALFVWKHLLNRGFEKPVQETLIYFFLVYYVLTNMTQVAQNTFTARMETAKIQIPILAGIGCRFVLIVIVTTASLGVVALACAYVVESAVIALGCLILFATYSAGKPDRHYMKSYLDFTLPVMIISVVGMVGIYADKVLIQLFWSSRDVGYYFASQKISDMISSISITLVALLFPAISGYHAKKDLRSIKMLTDMSERYLSMIVVPICMIVIIFSTPIIHVMLSDEYLPATTILCLFAVMALISTISRPYGALLLGMNQLKLAVKINIVSGLIAIGLEILFIPTSIFGIPLLGLKAEGAVIAWIIGTLFGFIVTRIWAYRLAGIGGNPRILLHLIAAFGSGICILPLTAKIQILRWYELLGAGLSFTAVYLCILWLLREFTMKDLRFVLDLLHPGKMWRYIRSELRVRKPKG